MSVSRPLRSCLPAWCKGWLENSKEKHWKRYLEVGSLGDTHVCGCHEALGKEDGDNGDEEGEQESGDGGCTCQLS
jgi:hypothetical protein